MPSKDPRITREHYLAFDKAKVAMMSNKEAVFFAFVFMSLEHEFEYGIPTMATDGKSVFINPDFFLKLEPEQRLTGLVHEALHVALMHFLRMMGRIGPKWNAAADYAINVLLYRMGFAPIDGWLMDLQYEGMSTEQIYDLLPDDASPDEDWIDVKPSDEKTDVAEEAIRNILVRASIMAKQAGNDPNNIPGEIRIYLDKLSKPKLPWNRILLRQVKALSKNDYSFAKPNRRFFPKHYLPGLQSESLGELAVAVDVSGSVSDLDFKNFISETCSLFRMMQPEKIHFIQFDTRIKSVTVVKSIRDLLSTNFCGRGGTDIEPVLKWSAANNPQMLLVFTDGYFDMNSDCGNKSPVTWLIHDNKQFKPSFGKVIHYENRKVA